MGNNTKGFGFKKFATPRIVGGIAIVVIVLWALSIIFGPSQRPSSKNTAETPHDSVTASQTSQTAHQAGSTEASHTSAAAATDQGHSTDTTGIHGTATTGQTSSGSHGATAVHETTTHEKATHQAAAGSHETTAAHQTATHGTSETAAGSSTAQHAKTHQQPSTAATHGAQANAHGDTSQAAAQHSTSSGHLMPTTIASTPVHKPMPKGVAFTRAAIKPLDYELEERWWGWRPNDIIDLTDNVNNLQMGVLEVTRRTTVALAERISRTGTTDAFDENLEQAMNWFMIKATSYWFPSAESKYREGLDEMQAYLEKLKEGKATFYTRTDNLIPLLSSFEDLLGSCDENLVKQVNEDGTPISSYDVDNYFFYTQGVASAMATVLEAAHHDFLLTLEQRNGTELLHHAIISCQRAMKIDPWIILDRNLSSVFANHRANMAAPISHARFYLGQLIKTLST